MKQFAVFALAALLASSALDVPCRAQSFIPTGSMAVERMNHQATLLANGSVLVTGGFTLSGYTNTAELYDPAFGTWRSTRRPELGGGPLLLNAARADHTATLLADGRVLIAGGGNQSSSLASAEIFDPVSETFTFTGSLNLARHTHTAAALQDGRVMVIAGNSTVAPCCYSVASTEIYSPATGSWIYAASVPTSGPGTNSTGYVFQAAVLLPDGKVLATGGHDGFTEVVSSAVMRYDPVANSWQVMEPMLQARLQHTATLLKDGRVLVVGGRLPTARLSLISTELYDPSALPNGTSVAGAPLTNSARAQHKSTLLFDGRVLVTGGLEFDEAAPYSRSNSSGQLYDSATGNWTEVGPMTSPRAAHTSTLLASGKVLITGGVPPYNYLGSIPVLKTAELWDGPTQSTGTIEVTTNLPAATFTITGPATYSGSGTSFTQTGAPAGTYSIDFGDVSCYRKPILPVQTLAAGGSIAFNGQYAALGSLTVAVEPAAATSATFSITPPISGFPTTAPSPVSRSSVAAGRYRVTFGALPGWIAPDPVDVDVTACGNPVVRRVYTRPVVFGSGMLSVDSNILGAEFSIISLPDLTVQWAGTTPWPQHGVAAGLYTLVFRDKAGYFTPPPQLVNIEAGDSRQLVGNYQRIVLASFTGFNNAPSPSDCINLPPKAGSGISYEGVGSDTGVIAALSKLKADVGGGLTSGGFTFYGTMDGSASTQNGNACTPPTNLLNDHYEAQSWVQSRQLTPFDKLVVLGHSYGGNRARLFTQQVKSKLGVSTDLLITVDAVDWSACHIALVLSGSIQPSLCNQTDLRLGAPNARRAFSFYQTRGVGPIPLNGYSVQGAERQFIDASHNEIDDRAAVQDKIVGLVRELARQPGVVPAVARAGVAWEADGIAVTITFSATGLQGVTGVTLENPS